MITKNLDTPLMLAARNGDVETLKALLESGVPVDDVDQDGRTAFIHASIPGEFDTAKLLLKAGANIDATDKDGRAAVHYIMLGRSTGRSERFLRQLLIKGGANLNVCDNEGFTPLMLCAKAGYFRLTKNGRLDLAKILISAGVDVDYKSVNGHTALTLAAADGNLEVCEVLVKAGAGPWRSGDAYWNQLFDVRKTDAEIRRFYDPPPEDPEKPPPPFEEPFKALMEFATLRSTATDGLIIKTEQKPVENKMRSRL